MWGFRDVRGLWRQRKGFGPVRVDRLTLPGSSLWIEVYSGREGLL